mmetsp:Transcript_2251/g.5323  ORF Transcript_2251/g.5323 Transcript_2251/m.5323 type:complete len:213 (+) Transcript_2251:4847-5485(+)
MVSNRALASTNGTALICGSVTARRKNFPNAFCTSSAFPGATASKSKCSNLAPVSRTSFATSSASSNLPSFTCSTKVLVLTNPTGTSSRSSGGPPVAVLFPRSADSKPSSPDNNIFFGEFGAPSLSSASPCPFGDVVAPAAAEVLTAPAHCRFSLGLIAPTASFSAAMCAGKVPQHPPTTFRRPFSANTVRSREKSAGVSSYPPIAFGNPAFG